MNYTLKKDVQIIITIFSEQERQPLRQYNCNNLLIFSIYFSEYTASTKRDAEGQKNQTCEYQKYKIIKHGFNPLQSDSLYSVLL